MTFNNVIFLCVFLPVVLILYNLQHRWIKVQNLWLLLTSLFFYAWNKPSFLVILLSSIGVNYIGGILVNPERMQRSKCGWFISRRFSLIGTILMNLLLLFYFKYFNFTMRILKSIGGWEWNLTEVMLPIGISFFTFQGLSYVIDVYRGDAKVQRNPLVIGTYISMFPQLVAGPIVRYRTIESELLSRNVSVDEFAHGIRRFVVGLCKKVIVADSLALKADAIFTLNPSMHSLQIAWLGAVLYSLQIFYDFSGYSDMAIGLGEMLGFHFSENFNYPYIATSITEFWRRWHMSLSTFFRDYVYIPLGGNKKHVYWNVALVFLLTGIWHGAAWTFILWGIWHGFFNLMEKLFKEKKKDKPVEKGVRYNFNMFWKRVKILTTHIYTLIVVIIGWVLFRAENVSYAWNYIKVMFGLGANMNSPYRIGWYLNRWVGVILIFAILGSTPIFRQIRQYVYKGITYPQRILFDNFLTVIGLLICLSLVASNSYTTFIYFQF